MPIYEFYCADCHTVFSFFSAGLEPKALPSCPRCGRTDLPRKPSTFAVRSGRTKEEGDEEMPPGLDEQRLEGAMESVLGDLGDDAEENPRQMAQLLRRFGEVAGLEAGPRMEEWIRRLEGGEDPEALEQDLGGEMGEDEAFEEFFRRKQGKAGRRGRPKVDKELYFL